MSTFSARKVDTIVKLNDAVFPTLKELSLARQRTRQVCNNKEQSAVLHMDRYTGNMGKWKCISLGL
jgi:hypothetical protein